jgi:putative chitinase
VITEDQLRRLFPRCEDPAGWVKPLNEAMNKFGIRDREEVASFLSQAGYESDHLNRVEENLRYSAARIAEVWPKQFADAKAAAMFAYNPSKLACRVYAGKNGNGPERTGDGYRYRGRGLFQLTGRANYKQIAKDLGVDLVQFPDALLERKFAALSAAAYWAANVKPGGEFSPAAATKAITGSMIALPERAKLYTKALEILDVGKQRVGSNKASVARKASSKEIPPSPAWA